MLLTHLPAQSITFSVVCEGGSRIRTFCGSALCSRLRHSTVDTWETWKDFLPDTCETPLCDCSCRRAPLHVKDRSLVTVVFFLPLCYLAVLTGNTCLFTATSCFRFSRVWKLPGATAAFRCLDSRKRLFTICANRSAMYMYLWTLWTCVVPLQMLWSSSQDEPWPPGSSVVKC